MTTTAVRPIPSNPDPIWMRAYRGIFWDRIKLLKRTGSRDPNIVSTTLGERELVLINRPEYIHEVLVEQADKFHKSKEFKFYVKPLLGNGLLLSEGEEHKRNRRLVAPAFIHRRIRDYAEVMTEYTSRIISEWKDGEVIDISREMMRITLAIAGKTLFGSEVGGEADEIKQKLTFLNRYADEQLRIPIHVPLSWPTPRNNRVRSAIATLDAIIYRMIAERRASTTDTGDLLSILLLARDEDDGGGMTDKQVRDEAMTIFLAGHETTSNGMSWMWYLLAQHPDIQSRLQAEVRALGSKRIALEDLPRLPYALQVFKEALRLYPPAYILTRTPTEDVFIDGYRIKKGAIVMISPYLLHRKEENFPEPEKFDPDRFSAENEKSIPRQAYLPFGAGPRVCIGNQFALIEAHLVTAMVAQQFSVELSDSEPVEMEPLITLRPKGG
ncbi:MAG: cytochrome P450, partial [Bacteroidota bacterium]|nr:cytochrome P450 [Bacteroidota bacterium]